MLPSGTPTEAEQKLTAPGVRSGYYLCFFGMHVLTPSVMDVLGSQLEARADDTADVIRRRQEVYLEETAPLIEVYKGRGLVHEIDGLGDVAEVTTLAAASVRHRTLVL